MNAYAQGDGKTTAVRSDNASSDATVFNTPKQETTSVRGSYLNKDISGSSLNVDLYYGDTAVGYPRYPGYQQSQIESEKVGLRTTIQTPIDPVWNNGSVSWGIDYLDGETLSKYYQESGLVPPQSPTLKQDSVAVFGQAELPLGDSAILRGGARYEDIDVETTTVENNRYGKRINGGSLGYEEFLVNLGAVYFVTDSMDIFANFSQGFSVGDLGRQIRGANPSSDRIGVSAFKNDAEETNQYETGLRYNDRDLSWSASAFYVDYKNGRTYNADLQIQLSDQEIWGVEGSVDYQVIDATQVGGTLTWSEGLKDTPDGGRERLPGTRISPLKLTGYLENQTTSSWSNRIQLTHIGSRDHFPANSDGFGEGEVDRYTVIDYVGSVQAGPGQVDLAVNNLLNKDYYPALSQAYYSFDSAYSATSRIKGQGRTISLGYSLDW